MVIASILLKNGTFENVKNELKTDMNYEKQ